MAWLRRKTRMHKKGLTFDIGKGAPSLRLGGTKRKADTWAALRRWTTRNRSLFRLLTRLFGRKR